MKKIRRRYVMTEQIKDVVILWPYGSEVEKLSFSGAERPVYTPNGFTESVSKLASTFKKHGFTVHIIGDGRKKFTLKEMAEELRKFKDPSLLFLAAHGGVLPDKTQYKRCL